MSCQIQFVNSFDYYRKRGFSRLDPQGVPLAVLDNPQFRLVVSLQGGQLLECYRKSDQYELLWLSPLNSFAQGGAIRGGIPICFPWFGVKQSNPSASKHGFVRNQIWRLASVLSDNTGIEIELEIAQDDAPGNSADYPYPFVLQQTINISESGLALQLAMRNDSRDAVNISWAWHTYFNAKVAVTSIDGLAEQQYLDNCAALQTRLQQGSVEFRGEVDRVYQPGVGSSQSINNGSGEMTVTSDAPSCIVWNPGELAGENMADVAQGYTDFICLERGCAFDQSLSLESAASFKAAMTITF